MADQRDSGAVELNALGLIVEPGVVRRDHLAGPMGLREVGSAMRDKDGTIRYTVEQDAQAPEL